MRRFQWVLLIVVGLCMLALIGFVGLQGRHTGPITIKTELEEGTVSPVVKLSKGELRFKTEEETERQLTEEDMAQWRIDALDFRLYGEYGGPFQPEDWRPPEEEALVRLMNQSPERWRISERLTESQNPMTAANQGTDGGTDCGSLPGGGALIRWYYEPRFYRWDEPEERLGLAYPCIFAYSFHESVLSRGAFLEVHVCPRDSRISTIFPGAVLCTAYGHRDSVIGTTPLSIQCLTLPGTEGEEGFVRFRALITLDNVDYEIYSGGLSQEDFIEFLLSVYEAPRPECGDVLAFILN